MSGPATRIYHQRLQAQQEITKIDADIDEQTLSSTCGFFMDTSTANLSRRDQLVQTCKHGSDLFRPTMSTATPPHAAMLIQ